jgi:hypothetical protein
MTESTKIPSQVRRIQILLKCLPNISKLMTLIAQTQISLVRSKTSRLAMRALYRGVSGPEENRSKFIDIGALLEGYTRP